MEGPFKYPTDFPTLSYTSTRESLPFHTPDPPYIGHYRKYPPPPRASGSLAAAAINIGSRVLCEIFVGHQADKEEVPDLVKKS